MSLVGSAAHIACPDCPHSWAEHTLEPFNANVDEGTLRCNLCPCAQPWPPSPSPGETIYL